MVFSNVLPKALTARRLPRSPWMFAVTVVCDVQTVVGVAASSLVVV